MQTKQEAQSNKDRGQREIIGHTSLSPCSLFSISITVLMHVSQKPLFPLTHKIVASLVQLLHKEKVHV